MHALPDPSALLFSSMSDVANLRDLHPPPMQAFMLWQTFLQNVNPLSKVIHAPLVQPQVIEASKDFDSVPKPSVALLFAIYAAAVMSLKEEDCHDQLNGPKAVLLSRYFSACQRALAAVSFMKSRNIVTLQAFVVFLVMMWSFFSAGLLGQTDLQLLTAFCSPGLRCPDVLASCWHRSAPGPEDGWTRWPWPLQ